MNAPIESAPGATPTTNPRTLPEIDLTALVAELRALRDEIRAERTTADIAHLDKITRWGHTATALGLGTAWMAPNLFSASMLSLGKFTRWTMLGHHVLHRGYDDAPGARPEQTSKGFARDGRRFIDWLDVIHPDAWDQEHNILHHYRLGEEADPDLVEENLEWLRRADVPDPLKAALVALLACGWKWIYYAPNTLAELQLARAKRDGDTAFVPTKGLLDFATWNPLDPRGCELYVKCLLPYAAWNFVAVPALFAPLGPVAMTNVLLNQLLAEVLTNLHTFAVIVPNHAGEDIFRFDEKSRGQEEFFLRQIVGSTNYTTGGDVVDFLHGFLNYQIEHHVFPDLSMLEYQRIQPRFKAICEKHGVPYVQENVFTRVKKTVAVMIGRASMPRTRTRRNHSLPR
jgi:fatty acid desaturase